MLRYAIGHVPGNVAVSQSLADISSITTLFAPDDDIHGALLEALKHAPLGTECHSSQYGFTDQDIADEFGLLASNPASRFLFDKTQAAGPHEVPILAGFKLHLPDEAQMAVGTSSDAHQILHTKAVALLYPDGTGWTMTGSFNLSASAEKQFNIVDIMVSRSRAELFAKMIDKMFDWVRANEPQ